MAGHLQASGARRANRCMAGHSAQLAATFLFLYLAPSLHSTPPPSPSPHSKMAAGKQSNIPAWGGGAGSRLAATAAAKKLQTAKDRQQARSASSTGFRPSEQPGAASSGVGACW